MNNTIKQLENIDQDLRKLIETKKNLVRQNIDLRKQIEELNKSHSKSKNEREKNKNPKLVVNYLEETKSKKEIEDQIDFLVKKIDKCIYLIS